MADSGPYLGWDQIESEPTTYKNAYVNDHILSTKAGLNGLRLPKGILGPNPASTPKYARNDGSIREGDFRDTLARMFIQLNPKELDSSNSAGVPPFVKSVTDTGDLLSGDIARVIGGTQQGFGNGNGGYGYIDFMLQSVSHNLQEIVDITQLLSDNYVAYYFGQAPATFSYSGMLVNSRQDDQAMNMLRIYRDMARGSQLARRKKLLTIRYDGLVVRGTLQNLSWQLQADNEMLCPFNFSLLVKKLFVLPNPDAGLTIVDTGDDPSMQDPSMQKPVDEIVHTNIPGIRLNAVPSTGSATGAAATLNQNVTGNP